MVGSIAKYSKQIDEAPRQVCKKIVYTVLIALKGHM